MSAVKGMAGEVAGAGVSILEFVLAMLNSIVARLDAIEATDRAQAQVAEASEKMRKLQAARS